MKAKEKGKEKCWRWNERALGKEKVRKIKIEKGIGLGEKENGDIRV